MKDIFQQDIILENERVLLRPLHENDFEHFLPFSLHEPWWSGGKELLQQHTH